MFGLFREACPCNPQPERPDFSCSLAADLDTVVAWGARTLVTLMEWREFARAGVEDLPRMAERFEQFERWRQIITSA